MFIFDLTVVPGSNTIKWQAQKGNPQVILVCHHKEPDDSKTVNTDIINIVSQALGINHSKVHIVAGTEDRKKRVKISEVNATYQQLLEKLGVGV
jgi:uncharacterized protein YggU (UPF0235/DUF167 family)